MLRFSRTASSSGLLAARTGVPRRAPFGACNSCLPRSALHGASLSSVSSISAAFMVSSRRHASTASGKLTWTSILNPFDWGFIQRDTHTPDELKDKLPEIFQQQPIEVQDYIRPERTMFEKLEDYWDWFTTFLSPIDKQVQWMRDIHVHGLFGLDMSWGMTFVLWGIIMRGISLLPMLYAHRNTLRLAAINPQLNEITQKLKQLKQDRTLTSAERRIEKEGYNRMRNALYTKHQCSQYKSFASGVASPLLVTAFMAIRRLATYEDDLESATFLWVKDLTLPDPTFMLPCICSAMFLINFELNQSMNRGGRSAVGMYMRWGVRIVCVVALYFFNAQPAALFCYWIGLSGCGILQPVLLRSRKFRTMFNFPLPPQAVIERKAAAATSIFQRALIAVGLAAAPSAAATAAAAQAANASAKIVDKQTGAQYEKLDDATFEVVFDPPAQPSGRK